MKYRLINSQKVTIYTKITECLSEGFEDVIAAYVFGSFRDAEEFADIDVGILCRKDLRDPLSFELQLEGRLERLLKYPVDVRVLNQAPLTFCQDVIRKGRLCLDRAPNRRADFEGRILKEYFDFAPFRQRYLQEVLDAPV